MTPKLFVAVATTIAISSAAAAQQPPRSSTQPVATAPGPGATVTVTGCVQRGEADGSIAGTALGTSVPPADAGPTANVNPPVGFMLTDATPLSAAAHAPAAPGSAAVGTTGSADKEAPANRTSYALEGNADELTKHLGHRMEVTGTVAPVVASGAGTTPAGRGADDARAHAGAPAPAAGNNGHPMFKTGIERVKVASMKMVSGDCTPATR